MLKFEGYRLGENDELVEIDAAEQHRAAATMMAQQCRHSIDIVSRDLDPSIYDTPEFVDATRRLVLTGQRPRVRIIVFNPSLIAHRGHRLVDAASQLTTFYDLRKAGDEHKHFNGSLFIADTTGYIHRLSAERFEGKLNFSDKRQARLFEDEFEEMWAKASPDINLRRLSL
ncbi:MAG: hypothetical protein HYY48_05645 [Gammaproteobacteria bacterium]|nr:hypothetical protein [Gammaproteobacteria bacterium]